MQTIRRRPNARRTISEDDNDSTCNDTSTSNSTPVIRYMPNFSQPTIKINNDDNLTPSMTSTMPTFSQQHNNAADMDLVSEIPREDLIMTPIVTANTDGTRAMDDSFIRRLSLGAYADLEQNSSQLSATRTTPRRPPGGSKVYLCPSNTFVASNGEVYHVDPFQLPPPSEIAELFKEMNQHRVNAKLSPRSSSSAVSPVSSAHSGSRSPAGRGGGAVEHLSSSSRATANKKYPSLPSEWMRTPLAASTSEVTARGKGASPPKHTNGNVAGERRRGRSPSFILCQGGEEGEEKEEEEEEEEEGEDSEGEDDEPFNFKKFSWRKFILAEMLGIGQPAGPLEPVAAESIDNFLSVPYKLECLIVFGCFVALDSFLYVITYLPIRFFFAVYLFVDEVMLPRQLKMGGQEGGSASDWSFPRNRVYDFMRGLLLLVGCCALSVVDMSRVYHYIRMQNTLKLYALTGMMEIIDKLLCSFGIDVLDSLFVKSRDGSEGVGGAVFTFIVAAVYVVIHSGLYFLHLATLTVAINNQDQSLITVLILNNFAEIKSSVLKKFDSGNLFQLACSDIAERFKMFLFYTLIMVVGVAQARDLWESFQSYGGILLAMMFCEMAVDWIKHAFIAKFNSIKSNCYIDYSRALRNDILNGHNDKITLDHSYTITKRLGMSQIPLGVVFFKYLSIGAASSRVTAIMADISPGQILCCSLVAFVLVLVFKVLLAVGLIYYTAHMNSREKAQEKAEQRRRDGAAAAAAAVVKSRAQHDAHAAATSNKSSSHNASEDSSAHGSSSSLEESSAERKRSVEALSNIERYTMLRGRINA